MINTTLERLDGAPGGQSALRLDGLDALLRPRGIAIIGASTDESKIGGRPLRFLRDSGYAGGIYPINPRYPVVQGLRAYATLDEVADVVDLALVAVSNELVFDAIQACARQGVKVAIVFSANFAEAGTQGAVEQRRLVDFARAHGVRVLGPNCIGSSSRVTGATATFAAVEGVDRPAHLRSGVAFVSQSGAIAAHAVFTARARGLGFDPWISTGNEGDIEFADALALLALDPDVKVIAGYLEGCRNGDALREALALARSVGKPVVLLKAGRSEIGAQAAVSHTASLVGSEQAFDAIFEKYGVCRVDSIQELVDVAYGFSFENRPAGNRLGVLTGSGGVGIIMADAAEAAGLELPQLSADAQATLKGIWPAAGVANPIDTTAQVSNDTRLLSSFLTTVLGVGEYDTIVVFLTYLGAIQPWAGNIVAALREARHAYPDASIVVSMHTTPDVLGGVEALGIPVFEDPTIAIRTIARLAEVSRSLAEDDSGDALTRVAAAARVTTGPINEVTAKRILAEAGVPMVAERVATTADEAQTVAAELGFPVVMKIVSADIAHKTEVGGVRIGISDARAAAEAFSSIMASVAAKAPAAAVDGVLVAPQIGDGVETIMGVVNDPTFGPTVMFGLGGVFVEVLKDVAYRIAPFDHASAVRMIREIKGFPLLDGARGAPPADIDALASALSNLSRFAAEHQDDIESIDINPFLVRPRGRGAIAVDALIVAKEA